jgi:hypothetical protein
MIMLINGLLSLRCTRRPHVANWSLGAALAVVLLGALPLSAQAQQDTVCGPDVKEYVVSFLKEYENASPDKKAAAEEQIYKQFAYCAQDAAKVLPADPFRVAARQCGAGVPILGSIFYEEMPCCGYDPQRRQFACPVKIKQPFGFGGSPLPGSREHVLHCVADANGVLLPVGNDSVHLSNSNFQPTWQFAVIAAAKDNLQTVQPMNGQPRRARSILSWQLVPTGCNYQPIWGNALDYVIRLDQ